MADKRFISITNYCLVEYEYSDLGSLDYINEDFILLDNGNNDTHQIYNPDSSLLVTKNIQDLTATQMSNNKYVYLDSEKVPNYIDYDPNITYTTISGYNVVMDKIRLHFVSGFEFDAFKAMVISVRMRENNNKTNVFTSLLLNPITMPSIITFNPKPLFFGNATYDRYIDIYVPSIKNINEEFNTSVSPQNTFAAKITPDDNGNGVGFVKNDPITISIDECSTYEKFEADNGVVYDTYIVSMNHQATLPQINEFDNVGTFISDSTEGDYIEFFLTFNGGFPEELISILNRRNPNDQWIIIHELSVYEQIGSAFNLSSRQVFFQEDSFDEPQLFRPILKNANTAITMSIDYIARLYNKRNGEQVIREGSYILPSPKKYGKKLINLELQDKPQSHKIYNKIYKQSFESTKLFIEPQFAPNAGSLNDSNTKIITKTEYVPVFYNNNNIVISDRSTKVKERDDIEEVVFAKGDLRFILSPFDNFLKFKVYTIVDGKPVPMDLNDNASSFNLTFIDNSGNKIKIGNLKDPSKENPAEGEIAFMIPKKDSEVILESEDRSVYLSLKSSDGKETMLYYGQWRNPSEYQDVENAIAKAKAEAESRNDTQTKIKEIETKIETEIKKNNDTKTVSKPQNINLDIPGLVKKATKKVPTVNRIGLKNPTGVTANKKNTSK